MIRIGIYRYVKLSVLGIYNMYSLHKSTGEGRVQRQPPVPTRSQWWTIEVMGNQTDRIYIWSVDKQWDCQSHKITTVGPVLRSLWP